MMKILAAYALMFFLTANLYGCKGSVSDGYKWNLSEMGTLEGMVEMELDPDNPQCKEEQCTFQLHYFVGGKKFSNSRKTILFIPGGPGYVVNHEMRDLEILEDDYNVVYFDIRGSGLSQIPPSNEYDKYLRAKFVVQDIEKLRKRLGIKFWDAIFAHSHGTIVAQLYAERYGEKNDRNPEPRVQKLILSAPVVGNPDIGNARRGRIVTNLGTIYQNYRSQRCTCTASRTESTPPNRLDSGKAVDDFCFLNPEQIEAIKKNLVDIMKEIEVKYGSSRLVIENYDRLLKTDFAASFPFPKGFFLAFGALERYGSKKYEDEKKETQISAAHVLGYYASFNPFRYRPEFQEACAKEQDVNVCKKQADDQRKQIRSGEFIPNRPFFTENAPEIAPCGQRWKEENNRRLRDGLKMLERGVAETSLSARAYYVYGVYDGVGRLFTRETDVSTNRKEGMPCVKAAAIKGRIDSVQNPVVRDQLQKIGIIPDEEICPWQPGKYSHSVPTVILSGRVDPVTGGCQVEDVFNDGLKGDRVLIELPGMGHNVIVSPKEVAFIIPALKSLMKDEPFKESVGSTDFLTAQRELKFNPRLASSETRERISCEG